MGNLDFTPAADLTSMLAGYKLSLESEFSKDSLKDIIDDNDEISTRARKILAYNLGGALGTMAELSRNAMSESVRFQAAKFVVESVLGTGTIGKNESEFEKVLKQLQELPVEHSDHED